MKPISVQLYALREQSKHDFAGVLKHVAAIGYKGVEPAGLYGLKPVEARRIVEDLGMVVELAACATDMMEAVAGSYRYLVGQKLAAGNKPA